MGSGIKEDGVKGIQNTIPAPTPPWSANSTEAGTLLWRLKQRMSKLGDITYNWAQLQPETDIKWLYEYLLPHLLPTQFLGADIRPLPFSQDTEQFSRKSDQPKAKSLKHWSSTNSLPRYSTVKKASSWQAPPTCTELPVSCFSLPSYSWIPRISGNVRKAFNVNKEIQINRPE